MSDQGRYDTILILFNCACACRASIKYRCQRCHALDYLEREWPAEYASMAISLAKEHGKHHASR